KPNADLPQIPAFGAMSTGDRGYALITGASQGIGKAIALELARNGFGIIGTARNAAGLDDLKKEAGTVNGGRSHVIPIDLLSEGAVDRIVTEVSSIGPISC